MLTVSHCSRVSVSGVCRRVGYAFESVELRRCVPLEPKDAPLLEPAAFIDEPRASVR